MTRSEAGLGWMAGAWFAGLGLAGLCPDGPWRVGAGIAALTLGALAALLGFAPGARAALLGRLGCVFAALLAGLSAQFPAADGEVGRIDAQGEARLVGEVERARVGEAVVRITGGVWLDAAQSPLPAGARVRLRPIDTTRGRTLVEGERFRALVRLRPVSEFRNPTPHPRWRAGAPLDGIARIRAGTRAESLGTPVPAAWVGAVRAALRHALDTTLSARTAGVARALVLGEGEAVDDAANRAVRDAGLAHVLAVSGLHVVILVGLVVVLLRRVLVFWTALAVRVDVGRVAAALGVPLALVYAALAGGAPSAWRAAVAAAMSYGLVAAGRRPRAGAVAALAAMVLAAWSPADAMRPALLLSVLATAALVGAARPQTRLLVDADARPFARTLATVREATLASVRTTLATAPLVVWCFEGVPLVGVAANLALVPVGSFVLLPLAALHALVATLLPFAAPLTAAPLETCTRAFLTACEAFAAMPFGRGLPPLSVPEGLVLAAICGLLFVVRTWRDQLLVLAAGTLALCAAELHLRRTEAPRGVLRATFLDVGQGDATLLDLPDGSLMLVDAGGAPRGGPDPGLRAIVPLLRARRRDTVDVLVITHPHPDHYGGAKAVLEHVRVREVWDGGQGRAEQPEGEASQILADAQRRGARLRGPETLCDTPRNFGAARVEVLWPCPHFDTLLEPNDNSLVLRVTLGAHVLLLAGAVARAAERALVQRDTARLRADVLKVPHHGSRTSSGRTFLRAVRPRYAVVSAGRGNGFGHPHAEVLERLGRIGARVRRLDRLGGVIARTDGRTLTLTP
jgi:competence protein ComEC